MSIPCLIVLMDVGCSCIDRTHMPTQTKETPRNTMCTVCVCVCVCVSVFGGVLLCWLQMPHSREGLSKNSRSSELTEEGPASRQPGINHYSLSHTHRHTHTHTDSHS